MMNGSHSSAMALANPSALHLGQILAPGASDTISIVFPLSAQLAQLRNVAAVQAAFKEDKGLPPKVPKTNPPRIKEDKTKGLCWVEIE